MGVVQVCQRSQITHANGKEKYRIQDSFANGNIFKAPKRNSSFDRVIGH
jgi:hypothetical protein